METRFPWIGGVLIIGIAATALFVRPPQPSVVVSSAEEKERPVTAPSAQVAKADTETRQLPGFYGDNVRSALFARSQPTLPAPPPQIESSEPPSPTLGDPPKQAPDVFADYVYTGTVMTDGQVEALLENPRTRSGGYYRKGDAFLGAKIVQVDSDAVTLDVHGKKRRFLKSSAYNVVPLNAQAGASTEKNLAGGPNPNAMGLNMPTPSPTNNVQNLMEAFSALSNNAVQLNGSAEIESAVPVVIQSFDIVSPTP